MPSEYETVEAIENWAETYVVGEKFTWTYIFTHEESCGPYFIERKYDTEMDYVYQALKSNPVMKNKITISDDSEWIEIVFHEYLTIKGSTYGNGIFLINDNLTHVHLEYPDDAIKEISDIANGEWILIENRRKLSILVFSIIQPWNLKIMKKEKFAIKKDKYMKKKYLRIYSGKEIIKRTK